jgi:hypothetical protein
MGKFLDKDLSLLGILRLERDDESFLQSRPSTRCNGCSDFKAEDERAPSSPHLPCCPSFSFCMRRWRISKGCLSALSIFSSYPVFGNGDI